MKPRLFIGSSSQRLPIARALKQMLADSAEIAVWDEAAELAIGDSILDGLIKVSVTYDFAILLFGRDDCTMMGGVEIPTVRDNVIFELGLFMGQMGRGRAFWLSPQGAQAPHMASDLAGIVHLSYKEGNTTDAEAIRASLAEPAGKIRSHVATLGLRTDRTGHMVPMRQALCLASSQYTPARFQKDLSYIHDFFSEREVTHEHGVTAERFQSYFEPDRFWDIVHLGLFVDKEKQRMLFDAAPGGGEVESLSLEAIEGMIKDCGASLVVIITCDSLRFGERLARLTNVIAGHQPIAPTAALSWAKVFYKALSVGLPLSRAFDKAQDETDPGLVLLARRDLRFSRA
jgi:hypothetical protein